MIYRISLALTAALVAAGTARAQDVVQPPAPVPGPECELHVWPTQNYIGINTGLLSGFGLVGALVDVGVHGDRVATVKDLMAQYLGPEVQLAELDKIGIVNTLKLANYRIVVEEPTPFNEDLKKDPAVKARVDAMWSSLGIG